MNWNPMTESLPAHALREITLVVAEQAELDAVNAALEREHYLGAVTPNNREVVQLALRHNQVLAIVVWTRAARKLAAREAWLGWDGRTRTRRWRAGAVGAARNHAWPPPGPWQPRLGAGCRLELEADALRALLQHLHHLDALRGERFPDDAVGREFLIADHHLITRPPVQAEGDERQRFGGVFHQRDIAMRGRVEQALQTLA